jgi:hypothetical protein
VAETHFRDMAGKLAGDLPEESFVEKFLRSLKLRAEGAEPPKDSVIDVKGPMAVVMVLPALDVKGLPVGVVIKTSDYKKLLEELAKTVGAAGVEVTPDGTDLLKGDKTSLFAASMGQFAVVADAEYVVRTFKAESARNLAASKLDAIKQSMLTDDAVLYVNLDELVKTYGEQINQFKQMMVAQLKNAPADANAPMDKEKLAKILEAEIDFAVSGASQVDALCYGFRFSADGAQVMTHVQALPDTAFARIAALVKPAPLDALNALDAPALLAAGWNFDPALMDEVVKIAKDFVEKSGILEGKPGEEDPFKASQKIMAALSGPGAFLMEPPIEGKGLLRVVYVVGLKPNMDVRADWRDSIQKSLKTLTVLEGPVKVKSKLEAEVEKYRDFPVDRLTLSFEANPEAPEAAPRGPNPLQMIETLYGPEMVVYLAQVRDKLVYTVGYAKSDRLKAQIDKLLDGKAGSLTSSPAWQSATKGLSPAPAAVLVVSYADLLRVYMAQILGVMDPDLGKAIGEVKFDKPSGVGCTLAAAPKGVVLHANIPMQEMENLKTLFMAMQAKMVEKMGAHVAPAPGPAPAPAPAPVPDQGAPPGP